MKSCDSSAPRKVRVRTHSRRLLDVDAILMEGSGSAREPPPWSRLVAHVSSPVAILRLTGHACRHQRPCCIQTSHQCIPTERFPIPPPPKRCFRNHSNIGRVPRRGAGGGWNVCRLVLLSAVDAPAARRSLVAYRKQQHPKVPRSMDCRRTVSSDSWRPCPCPALWWTMFHVKRSLPTFTIGSTLRIQENGTHRRLPR